MEVSPVTYAILKALYPTGTKILASFQQFQKSLSALGNAMSIVLGVQLQEQLIDSLGENWSAFCEHSKDYWCPSLYIELFLTVAPVFDTFKEQFLTIIWPSHITDHLPDIEQRKAWEEERGLEAFPKLKFPRSLEDVLSEYSIIATSFKSMPPQNPRKCSISSPGKNAKTVAMAPKKAKHSGSTKPKPAPTNPRAKASQATSSKISADETVIIKVEKSATPSSSKVATSHIIVSPPVLNKEDPPVALTSLKGKSKATPLATDEEDELNTSNRSEDVYDSIKIPAPGVQGRKLTEKTDFADHILKYFSSAQVLLNALNSVAQVTDGSGSLLPLSIFLHSTTMLPPITLQQDPYSSLHSCDGCCKSSSPCSHNRLWFEWVNDSAKELDVALGSCSGLIYQASSICHDIALYTSLLKTQAHLDEQLVALSHSINVSQDAFKKCVIDPRQILQSLLFLDPSFSASDAQVASLCASFSWRSLDLLLQDPHDHGYKLHKVFCFSDSPFHIFVKGTDINITSKKGFKWEINNEDLVVPTTAPDVATTAEASRSTIDASDVDIVAEKSAAVSSSTPSLLSLRDSLIPMSFSPVSSLLRDDSDQSPDIWSLPSLLVDRSSYLVTGTVHIQITASLHFSYLISSKGLFPDVPISNRWYYTASLKVGYWPPYYFLLFSICCLDISSPSTTANASSEWTDHPGWLTDMHAVYDHCRESAVKPLLCIKQAAATQMCEQLGSKCKPLNFRHVAHSDEAYTLYSKAIDLIKELFKLSGVKEPFQLSAITHFLVEMDAVQAADKACGSCRSKKSSKVVEDGSDDDKVIVLTVPSEDTKMADAQTGLNASMHAPKPATTDAVKSLRFTKEKKTPKEKKDCLITSSSINAELGKVSKCPHLEHPIADLREESPEECNLWVTGADSIIRHTALVPFIDLEKMSTGVLLSVSNFLQHEMSTLEHNVHFFSSQYKLTCKQFEEASRIWLSKLELADKLMADVEVVPSPQETVAGPSNAASQVAE
ncbi:hypothetical protein Moror_15413 [Moniliophthora roreri MCA 2997]|uniref:Uncharacterized protein n=1 Tax=Moniliophthora roreri (strain MCA 2997) TaxID=1381753 RepID=V2WK08_MONRO|nr:hypothetical protein Moror_15413 [Moniliophthora roreri MCA 2997]